MTDLPPFDPDSQCQKCGGEGAEARYCRGVPAPQVLDGRPVEIILMFYGHVVPPDCSARVEGEHQHRTCRRCRYEWLERPWQPPPPPPRRKRQSAEDTEAE